MKYNHVCNNVERFTKVIQYFNDIRFHEDNCFASRNQLNIIK